MIKPIEIYNMYYSKSRGFEMYLYLKDEYKKPIKITGKGKYKDQEFYDLYLTKDNNVDIIQDEAWWLNLKTRNFHLSSMHIYEQFELDGFNFDSNTNKLVFTFKLVKDKVEFL